MAAEDEVRRASDRFYGALNQMLRGDAGPMMEVWAHQPDVTTLHPIGGRQVGWNEVRASFEQFAQLCSGGELALRDPLIRVASDLAYELAIEAGEATVAGQQVRFDHRVTNIYRRDAGGWKMVHHHSDTDTAIQTVLGRM